MYTVKFEDGSIFNGGNPENSLWNKMPNKSIAEITYILAGKSITLKGFSSYNHQVKIGYLPLNSQQFILAVIVMAEKEGIVKRFIFDFTKNKFFMDEVKLGQEYNNKSVSGWKKGNTEVKLEWRIF